MLTDEQAIAYCERKDRPTSSQIYNAQLTEWRRLANAIRHNGLERVIADQQAFIERVQKNTDPRHSGDTTIAQEFLNAVYNDEEEEDEYDEDEEEEEEDEDYYDEDEEEEDYE